MPGRAVTTGAEPPAGDPREGLVRLGERFGGQVRLSEEEIRRFATLVGDFNPLHHDAERARASRFGRLIASGMHVASLMMGRYASYFTRADDGILRDSLGMDFRLRFTDAVFADEDIDFEWTVMQRQWKPKLRGWVVSCEGVARCERGEVLRSDGVCLLRLASDANA